MGLIDRISGLFTRNNQKTAAVAPAPPSAEKRQMAVAVDKNILETEGKLIQTFSND